MTLNVIWYLKVKTLSHALKREAILNEIQLLFQGCLFKTNDRVNMKIKRKQLNLHEAFQVS